MCALRISHETTPTASAVIEDAWWRAQSFTPASSFLLGSLELKVYNHYTETGGIGECVAQIVAMSGGVPDHTDVLGATTFDGDTLPANNTSGWVACPWFTITFDTPVSLTEGVTYAIIIKALNTADASHEVHWTLTISGTYAGGQYFSTTNSGGLWTPHVTGDQLFRIYDELGTSTFSPTTDRAYNKKLVVAGTDSIFYESSSALTELAASTDKIDCIKLLQMCGAYQKVFVANETVLGVADFGNIMILPVDILSTGVLPVKGTLLTGDTNSAQMVVDFVDASTGAAKVYGQRVTAALFVDEDIVTGTNADDTAVSFVLDEDETAGPHWYNWTVFAALAATYGTMPSFAALICLYRGRMVLSGNKQFSYQWYMSRQGHPFDFNYAKNDAQTAVAGNNADAGELGDIVTALIPYKDDYLMFGCGSSIWYMAGDPAAGGSLNELDLTTGIYGAQSWCFDNEGNLYFWGTNGIYRTTVPGKPINISRIHLPNLVKDEAVDSSTHRITMAYDSRQNGILITITKFADNTHSNYFFDLATKGFFPESSHADCAIYSQLFYQGDAPDYRRLLVGCSDGYVRYYDEDTKSDIIADDTVTLINAYCTWGPLKLAQNDDYYGILSALEVITAGGASDGTQADSSNVSFRIFVADTAEELLEKLAANTDYRVAGTIVAPGRPKGAKIRKRFRGMFLGLRLWNSTAAQTWAINKIIGTIKKGGRFK